MLGGDLYSGITDSRLPANSIGISPEISRLSIYSQDASRIYQKHTVTKSKDVMLSSVFLTTAHHGATLVIDAIDPIGTMDKRVYERLGEVFFETMPYEKYFGGDMIEDVGIYYSLKSKV